MADFFSSGWSLYIILVSGVSIFGCYWLAYWVANQRAPEKPADGEVGTTGHVWDDDLEEYNNPLPRWWLYLFYSTCAFAVYYLFLYPGLGNIRGMLGWTSAKQYESEMARAAAAYDPLFEKYLDMDIADVSNNPEAVAMGERLYLTYCTQCHGSDARGSRSFPNLADNDWLGAGDPEYIKHTIQNGRTAVMPTMLEAIGNTEEDLDAMANYVLSLSGSDHDAALAAKGETKWAVCSACHGPDATGLPAIGAPNLTDDTWLYGGSIDSIKHAIRNGFNNQMPSFGERVGEGKAHVLAAYIWSLSNEERAASGESVTQ
ncbi:MAG: cytochrome-c oxidase, cbb3-type subunit III [Gammaproteobacteria bacterium]|nr:MAG: cytochrome-c oxidase, cbb3-type subunit III [Gammaproteobacteria bacterium]